MDACFCILSVIYCLIPFGWTVLIFGAAHIYVIITRNIVHIYVLYFGNLALRALIVLAIIYTPCIGNLALQAFIISFIIHICILRFTCFRFPIHVIFFFHYYYYYNFINIIVFINILITLKLLVM